MDEVIAAPSVGRAEEEAGRIAGEVFGIAARAKRLPGEKDLNFRMTTAEGRRTLLKVFTADADTALVGMHGAALRHVARAAPDLPVQRLIPTREGAELGYARFLGGAPRCVRMVSFLEGVALDDSPHRPEQRRSAGGICARLQVALKDFTHPAARHALVWDMKEAPKLRRHLALFEEPDQRRPLEAVLDAYEARIASHVAELPAQVVHNDLNGNNLLVSAANSDEVTGVIDFDDMVHTPRLFDLAVGAAYQMIDHADPVGAICDFAHGFGRVFRPGEREIGLLYTAVRTRMAMRLILLEWRARQLPDNRGYLTRNCQLVWQQFARLAGVGNQQATDRIAQAF